MGYIIVERLGKKIFDCLYLHRFTIEWIKVFYSLYVCKPLPKSKQLEKEQKMEVESRPSFKLMQLLGSTRVLIVLNLSPMAAIVLKNTSRQSAQSPQNVN
jgi:hypothetical protein